MKDLSEIWKPVVGFEGIYEVSNFGNVKSIKTSINLSFVKHRNGYVMASLNKKGYRKNCTIHRLVAMAFIPNPSGLPEVNHKDANKTNNHSSNLEWVSKKGQMQHASSLGLLNKTPEFAIRMSEIGKKYAPANIERLASYHNRTFVRIRVTNSSGQPRVFQSFRQMEKALGIDRKTASKRLDTGIPISGYLITTDSDSLTTQTAGA